MRSWAESFDEKLIGNFHKFFILFPFSVSGWIIGLSQIANASVIGWCTVICVIVYYAAFFIYLIVRVVRYKIMLKEVESSIARIRTARNRLGETVASKHRTDSSYYSHTKWHELIQIREGGDTTITRDIVISPGVNGIDFAFLNIYGNSAPSERSKVAFSVHLLTPNGAEIDVELLEWWEKENKHTVFLFLDQQYQYGEELRIRAVWDWPAYSERLVSGESEAHKIFLSRSCSDFKCELVVERVGAFRSKDPYVTAIRQPDVTTDCAQTLTSISADKHIVKFSAANQAANSSFGIKITAAG